MNDLPPTTRLVSIDCIRILAMLLICVCHAAGGTGLMQVQDGDFNKAIALLIGVFSNIGVNLFILISGYCGILLKHKPERYFKLWLQVVFFTLLYLPCAISNHYFNSVSSLLGEILPIPLASGYWFFTAYTGLFILMPYLNHLIHQLSARQRYTLIVSLLFLFCILNRANTPELAGSGFNVIWLASIYLIGAVLRLNPPVWSNTSLIITIIIGQAGQTAVYIAYSFLKNSSFPLDILPSGYASPFLVMLSISVFVLISRINMQDWKIKKIVFALSPLMFGVYLAHMDAYIFSNHIKPICLSLLAPSGKANFFVIIIAGLMIFGAGCTMAYLQKTFFTIVRADSLAKWIANKWNLLTQKITSLLFCRQ